jgi:hypothetical protein
MSDPKWTPELQARCLEVARAARTEPETVESLRDALVASEAARVAAEERARVLGERACDLIASLLLQKAGRYVPGITSDCLEWMESRGFDATEVRAALLSRMALPSLPAAPAS